jgi:hypothetical protein
VSEKTRQQIVELAEEWADTQAPGAVSLMAQDYLALRDALEHLASPNRSARANGRDAEQMAAYARRVLDGDV